MASLREVFELVREQGAHGDPAGLLRDSGHADLPEALLSLAIVNFADTLPADAAEHLAGFVVPHSGVPREDADHADPSVADGLDLLATAPSALGPEADLDGAVTAPDEAGRGEPGEPPVGEPLVGDPLEASFGAEPDPAGLDFGTGDPDGVTAGPWQHPEPAGDLEPEVPVEVGAPAPDGPEALDAEALDAEALDAGLAGLPDAEALDRLDAETDQADETGADAGA
jgi:hypothetical protein